ncbi:MAG TPA: hypothetical protein VFV10_07000 [Gammaproteobacteria bacterium]|nr:hypothetical protein [Gammaproteobacteria bacterium]
MKKIDTLSLTGRSGRHYEFRLYVWQTPLKSVPAVYVVTERSIEPNRAPSYKPLFIGSTADVSKIFERHPKQDCFDLHYANTVGVLREGDPAARAAIETDLIDALSPPCNAAEIV